MLRTSSIGATPLGSATSSFGVPASLWPDTREAASDMLTLTVSLGSSKTEGAGVTLVPYAFTVNLKPVKLLRVTGAFAHFLQGAPERSRARSPALIAPPEDLGPRRDGGREVPSSSFRFLGPGLPPPPPARFPPRFTASTTPLMAFPSRFGGELGPVGAGEATDGVGAGEAAVAGDVAPRGVFSSSAIEAGFDDMLMEAGGDSTKCFSVSDGSLIVTSNRGFEEVGDGVFDEDDMATVGDVRWAR